jgi:hypothetical protein
VGVFQYQLPLQNKKSNVRILESPSRIMSNAMKSFQKFDEASRPD